MRIACPSCAATYEVPEKMLGSGPRTLRCARCGKEWTQPALTTAVMPAPATPSSAPTPAPRVSTLGAAEAEALPGLPPAPPHTFDPGAFDPGAEPPASPYAEVLTQADNDLSFRRPPATTAWVGWAASIIVLAALVWAGYNFRAGVMHAWPPSQRLYATLGLTSAPAHAPPAATSHP